MRTIKRDNSNQTLFLLKLVTKPKIVKFKSLFKIMMLSFGLHIGFASAVGITGNVLLKWDELGFLDFVMGVNEALVINRNVCYSKEADYGQISAIVRKYINEHPEYWDRPAVYLIANPLMEKFPCKSGKKLMK